MRRTTLGGEELQIPAIPVRIAEGTDEAPAVLPPLGPPPGLGHHTEEVRRELGLGDLAAEGQ